MRTTIPPRKGLALLAVLLFSIPAHVLCAVGAVLGMAAWAFSLPMHWLAQGMRRADARSSSPISSRPMPFAPAGLRKEGGAA